jgi:signal transduction histidine kinase
MTARPWSLRRRLARTFILVGTLATLVVVIAGAALAGMRAAQQEVVDRQSPALIESGALLAAYLDQETGVRGYALSNGATSFLQPYQAGVAEERSSLTRLHRLLATSPADMRRLGTVVSRAAQWQTEYARPTIADVRAGRRQVDFAGGKRLFDPIRTALDDFRERLAVSRAAARDRLHRALVVLNGLLGIAVVGFAAIGIALWLALRGWVIRPLSAAGAEVRLVASGDLAHRVRVEGPREILDLAADVDAMRQRIVTAYDSEVGAREEVQATARLLGEQAQELRRSNAELEQFAYVASHDLQEPLRKVASFCQMLERRYKGQLDERADQYIEFAVDGAKRMQRLINDLLAFSRVGRHTADFVPVDLDIALAAAQRNVEARLEEAGGTVIADPLPTVRGDATLLTQVFQNLLANAVKFRSAEPPVVQVSAVREGAEWHFRCADNGIGIEPQYADRVFVIFQRLHAKDEYEGTGIGLALCKKIVEYHNGRIWIDTDRAVGATIHWTLPVYEETGPTDV